MFLKRLNFTFFITLCLCLLSSVSKADQPSIESQKYPVITATTQTSTTVHSFSDSINSIWEQRITSTDYASIVKRINKIKLDNGFTNLYPYSLALIYESNEKASMKLVDYAALLSPSMPEPYLLLSYHILTSRHPEYANALMYLMKGIKLFFADPYNLMRFISNRLINITFAIFFTSIIFSLLLLFRYYPQIHKTVRSILPGIVPNYAIVVFAIIIGLIPLLFGLGPIWLIILWLFMTLIYQKPAERILSIGFIAFLAMFTYITLIGVATILEPVEQPLTSIMDIYYGTSLKSDIYKLKSYADSHPDDLYSNLYTGLYLKKTGDYGSAFTYYKRLINDGYENSPLLLINMGNLEYAMGNKEIAEQDYKDAIKIDPASFEAHYNLGQLYLANANIKGSNELDKAKILNPSLFGYFASIYDKSNVNRIFIDAMPSANSLAYRMFKDTLNNKTAISLTSLIISKFITFPGASGLPSLGIWLLIVYLLLILLSKYMDRPLRCRSCGKLYNAFNRNDEYRKLICNDCLNYHVKKDLKNDKKKLEIIQRIVKWKKLLKEIDMSASILIPGAGYILRGLTLRGVLILFVFSYLLIEYITSFGLISNIFPVNIPFIVMLKTITLIAVILLYLLNLLFSYYGEAKWF
ncbi:MAG: tetratricopeptide repeat protein [Deltaproteobacteria bacterium]|nr:tetratricopeptide repeat protein [Deltaproteobacteria bacterium]MCL5792289.1 tetratricopeptide repeat protein [Deltaproteobacteria bacterium]